MAEMFSFLSGFGFSNILIYAVWIFVLILFCMAMGVIVILLLVMSKQKKLIEINMANRRLRIFNSRLKKRSKGVKQIWANKIKRYLPDFQQESIFVKGKQDTVILLKDNNGLYHTAKIPTYDELKEWYKVIHKIDLENKDEVKKKLKDGDALKNIYLLPSPHEDIGWLGNQCAEADTEFTDKNWWNSPVVAYIGVGFVCFLMVTATLFLSGKLI